MKYKQNVLDQIDAMENYIIHLAKQIESAQLTAKATIITLEELTNKLAAVKELVELED